MYDGLSHGYTEEDYLKEYADDMSEEAKEKLKTISKQQIEFVLDGLVEQISDADCFGDIDLTKQDKEILKKVLIKLPDNIWIHLKTEVSNSS